MNSIKDQKVWFINEASRGIGYEMAKGALITGDKVVAAVGKNPKKLLGTFGDAPGLFIVKLDISSKSEIRTGIRQAINHFGRIDIIANRTGYCLQSTVEETFDVQFRRQFDTNVFKFLNTPSNALSSLRQQIGHNVIHVSALLEYGSSTCTVLNDSLKAAALPPSQALALELVSFVL